MTGSDPARPPGYRGALAPREDRLARPWILTVFGALVLAMVLSALGVPSRFTPDPTPIPLPSILLPSASPVGSESEDPSATPNASGSASQSDGAGASASPSPSD